MKVPLLSFREVSCAFPDTSRGLNEISTDFFEGGLTILSGRNGAGKSLLMKHAIGLIAPTSGNIYFRGDPFPASIGEARKGIGYVFQDAEASFIGETVFSDTLFGPANLCLPKEEAKIRAEESLKEMKLFEKRSYSPSILSGGEKRRLSIAGIIAVRSSAIIFDEPFANLDYPSIRDLLGTLLTLKDMGKTLIVVTHELEKVLAHAERLLVMDSGRIAFDGVPESIEAVDLEKWGLRNPLRRTRRLKDLSWLT